MGLLEWLPVYSQLISSEQFRHVASIALVGPCTTNDMSETSLDSYSCDGNFWGEAYRWAEQ